MCCTIYFLIVYSAQVLFLIPYSTHYAHASWPKCFLFVCVNFVFPPLCHDQLLVTVSYGWRTMSTFPINPVHFSIPYPSHAAHKSCVKTSSHAMLDWFMPWQRDIVKFFETWTPCMYWTSSVYIYMACWKLLVRILTFVLQNSQASGGRSLGAAPRWPIFCN